MSEIIEFSPDLSYRFQRNRIQPEIIELDYSHGLDSYWIRSQQETDVVHAAYLALSTGKGQMAEEVRSGFRRVKLSRQSWESIVSYASELRDQEKFPIRSFGMFDFVEGVKAGEVNFGGRKVRVARFNLGRIYDALSSDWAIEHHEERSAFLYGLIGLGQKIGREIFQDFYLGKFTWFIVRDGLAERTSSLNGTISWPLNGEASKLDQLIPFRHSATIGGGLPDASLGEKFYLVVASLERQKIS